MIKNLKVLKNKEKINNHVHNTSLVLVFKLFGQQPCSPIYLKNKAVFKMHVVYLCKQNIFEKKEFKEAWQKTTHAQSLKSKPRKQE